MHLFFFFFYPFSLSLLSDWRSGRPEHCITLGTCFMLKANSSCGAAPRSQGTCPQMWETHCKGLLAFMSRYLAENPSHSQESCIWWLLFRQYNIFLWLNSFGWKIEGKKEIYTHEMHFLWYFRLAFSFAKNASTKYDFSFTQQIYFTHILPLNY